MAKVPTPARKRKSPAEMRGTELDPKKMRAVKKGLEIGDSGTEILGGIIREEYNSKLQETQGVNIYDEMRRSDGTVRAAVLATSLPIRRAKWYVESGSEDEKDKEIAEFVSQALFEWQSVTFDDFLRQALLSLPFGVMAFEKVFKTHATDGREWVVWKKFAPRLPKSIYKWEMQDGEPGIQQRRQDGQLVDIPIEKLCIFTNEKEGDNFWGTSILRAAYKHWFIKNNFYRIDNVAFERQGLGVPFVKLPENYTEDDRGKAEIILKNLRAHHHAYIIEPHDYEIGFKDMMAKSLRDPEPSIRHHNREIVKSVLAHFLELGATDSGSRALSEDQSGLFLHALEAVAAGIADVFNKYAIPQLVDLNFDNVEWYPKLAFAGIARTDVKALAEAYKMLTDAGGITPGKEDEQYLRETLGLPERDDEGEEDAAPADKDEDEVLDEVGLSENAARIKKKIYPERSVIRQGVREALAGAETFAEAVERAKGLVARIEGFSGSHGAFWRDVRAETASALADMRRRAFQEANGFKAWRVLTFAERKVDFAGIQERLDEAEGKFREEGADILERGAKKYIDQIARAVIKEDAKQIEEAHIAVKGAYRGMVKRHLRDVYVFGKNGAAAEMGREAPTTPSDTLRHMDITADTVAKDAIFDIEKRAKIAIVAAIRKPDEPVTASENKARAIGAAGAAVAAAIQEKVGGAAAIVLSGLINFGRNDVFEAYQDDIYALQWSAILDAQTCNLCLSLDARVFDKKDPMAHQAPTHSHCRCIIVEILKDEKDPPPIDGIPDSVRDMVGDETNDILQPRVPKVKKDSAASRELENRAKRRAQKQ